MNTKLKKLCFLNSSESYKIAECFFFIADEGKKKFPRKNIRVPILKFVCTTKNSLI